MQYLIDASVYVFRAYYSMPEDMVDDDFVQRQIKGADGDIEELDKLIDELAKGRPMDRILRTVPA